MTEKAKKLGEQNAFPFDDKNKFYYGMSLREYFAGLAMQGMLANTNMYEEYIQRTSENQEDWSEGECFSNSAIYYADALLEELAKENCLNYEKTAAISI